jgi:hypothetical protein
VDVRRGTFPFAQTNRFTKAVRKLLSIKGEAEGVSFGVHLEDERPEHSWLKDETRWAQFNAAGPSGAAEVCVVGVRNPAGSNVLLVVTDIWCYTAAAPVLIDLEGGQGTIGAGASSGSMFSTDFRGRGNVAATRAVWVAGVGAVGAILTAGHIYDQRSTLVAGDPIDLVSRAARVHPFVLPPGFNLFVRTDALGINTLAATIVGYERALESGELIG